MVNALQRRADVVVQKSLAEGFGLTVAEAMWKQRPWSRSRVGGIKDQIVDGESGLLLVDPADAERARSVPSTCASSRDPTCARRDCRRGSHQRVCDRFTPVHHYADATTLLEALVGAGAAGPRRHRRWLTCS